MSDPFADLLTSFKNGKDNAKSEPTKSNISATQKPASASPNISQLSITPLVPSPSPNVSIHDDFDDLFGVSLGQNGTNTIVPKQTVKTETDDIDAAFNVFQATPSQSIKPEASAPNDIDRDEEEYVVDEVKDMEVARLMSLGLSIDEANDCLLYTSRCV